MASRPDSSLNGMPSFWTTFVVARAIRSLVTASPETVGEKGKVPSTFFPNMVAKRAFCALAAWKGQANASISASHTHTHPRA